ncbi:hypothetical protein NCU07582 [Neurospora crassa OR74A]|uniref:Uncharacterized protein n=1 Tax=Neurospora crassa (strain ATCC 24698 / 74-OR23-1A / CBS 708.71 / DSM 1257 / FGSC 987) TaxID=367110 RepID=Q7SBH4_NEUCR|nr:hypothetical protein NCU07582 [Neurospora crassa OR74A]EAA33726.2 hypothetical protein NCU07582 [Neurospora crassa OR74A]|eukprot:XP_962962.2 hypothetical protein NCU07582 [Neurospora crassa OR74A]
MKATAPTLRWRNFARAEATRAWVEATKRQALNTSEDDSLSDTNSLNSLSDDNSLDSDSDAGRQQPPRTTNPPQLTGATKTRQRLTAGSRARVTRRSLEQRQAINTSDDDSVDSLDNSLDSADSSADEARPLPTSTTTKRSNLSSKTRARLAAKHRRALDARQALDSDSADSAKDSLDSGAESSADEAKPLGRPTRTQKRRARRTIDVRQALDSSADDNSLDSLESGLSDGNSSANEARPTLAPTNPPILAPRNRNRLTFGQRQQHKAAIRRSIAARQNNLQDPNTSDSNSLSDDNSLSSLSDNNSLDSNSVDSASDSDAARPQPTNPANLTSKAPKRLGAGSGASSRPTRISRREFLPLGKRNAPAEHPEHPEDEEDDAASVSSVSSGDSDDEKKEEEEKDEKEKEKTKTSTVTAAPTATAIGSVATTTTATVNGSATATITSTSAPSATSEPEDALAPVNSGDATALPNLSLAPAATATPSSVLGAIDNQPQADTQGQQTPVPTAKKMSAGATAGIVIGVLGFIALLAGAFFLFMKWRRRRRESSLFGPKTPLADEKGGPPPAITFTRPSWPNQNQNQGQGQTNSAQRDPNNNNNKTNSEVINDLIRAAYAAEGEGRNTMADAHDAANQHNYLDEKAYAMLAGHPPTPAATEKRGVSKWLADVMTPRQSTISMAQKWPYPVDPPPETMPVGGGGTYMPSGNGMTTTKQKRLTPPRLPLKPVVPPSMLRPGAAVGGTGLPPGSNVNPRMTVATQTTTTTSSSARWG